jgi:hypothetical protein
LQKRQLAIIYRINHDRYEQYVAEQAFSKRAQVRCIIAPDLTSHILIMVEVSHHSLRATWISLFSHPEITAQDLQDQANLSGGIGQDEDELGGVTLRSVYWRIYLGTLPLETLQSGSSIPLRSHLQDQRREYDKKREKWLKAPDGRWASDCSVPEDVTTTQKVARDSGSGATWDPLNLGEEVSTYTRRY